MLENPKTRRCGADMTEQRNATSHLFYLLILARRLGSPAAAGADSFDIPRTDTLSEIIQWLVKSSQAPRGLLFNFCPDRLTNNKQPAT